MTSLLITILTYPQSRYINIGEGEPYRPISEIVDELEDLETEAKATHIQLNKILKALR